MFFGGIFTEVLVQFESEEPRDGVSVSEMWKYLTGSEKFLDPFARNP